MEKYTRSSERMLLHRLQSDGTIKHTYKLKLRRRERHLSPPPPPLSLDFTPHSSKTPFSLFLSEKNGKEARLAGPHIADQYSI